MLDLDARVHLDEDVAAVGGEEELDGAGVDVADLAGRTRTASAHIALAQGGVEVGRRRDLDDLLVAALHRAVALEQVDDVAGAVGEDLHLDVARADHRLLEEDRGVAEGRLGLAHARLERVAQRPRGRSTRRMPRPPPPATALAKTGKPISSAAGSELVDVGAGRGAAQGRQPGLAGRGDGAGLVAGQVQHVGGRADEGDAGAAHGLGQVGVLREEAVAGVDGVRAGLDRGAARCLAGRGRRGPGGPRSPIW